MVYNQQQGKKTEKKNPLPTIKKSKKLPSAMLLKWLEEKAEQSNTIEDRVEELGELFNDKLRF